MYLHPTYAVSPAREPLGVLDAWMWARESKGADGLGGGLKESTRWIEGYERVAERAQALPQVRQVYVADREADILALLVKARDLGHAADYVIRCQHDRALPEGGKLWARLARSAVLGEVVFELPAGRGRKARSVTQRLRAQAIELADGAGGRLTVTCVLAEEIDPPVGAKPVILGWAVAEQRPLRLQAGDGPAGGVTMAGQSGQRAGFGQQRKRAPVQQRARAQVGEAGERASASRRRDTLANCQLRKACDFLQASGGG
jgi:hypothetical protein